MRAVANHLGIGRLTDREGDIGRVEVGKAAAQPRLGLRGVGRRDVAGGEALLRDAQRFPQEGDIGALGIDQRVIGQHVGIGGDGIEKHALADIAQRFAAGLDLQFGDPDAVGGLEAVEQGLGDGDANGPWLQGGGLHRIVRQQITDRLEAAAEAGDDLRTITGQRLGDVFVGGALPCPLGIELRIGLIGLDQRLRERVGTGSRGHGQRKAGDNSNAEGPMLQVQAPPTHAPSREVISSGIPNHVTLS